MAASPDELVSHARQYLGTPHFAKLWRYASISVLSTVLSLVLLYLFFNVAGIEAGSANLLATSITSVPAYFLTRNWAWGKTGRSHLMREVIPFWVIAIVSILLSTGAVHIAAREAHHFTHAHSVVTAIVLAANFFTYAVLWVVKFILFNRVLFKNDPDVDDSGSEDRGDTDKPASAAGPTERIASAFSRT